MTTEGGKRRRPIDPYYDLTHEAGRLNFHRLFNEELTTMGDYQRLRTNAVRPIAVYDIERYFDEAHGHDALIPYMAMTFVDRFLSKGSIPDVYHLKSMNRRLFLTSCLTLSWKLRNKYFHAATFMEKNNLDFSGDQLVTVEGEICNVLDWHLQTIMPFRLLDFFEPFVTLPTPRSSSVPLRPVYKLLIKSQYDVAFTKYRPSIMAASALLTFISNEFPSQLREFESNLIRGFFYPQFQKSIKKCQKKLAPLYGGAASSIVDSGRLLATPFPSGRLQATPSTSAVGDQGAAASSSGTADQDDPALHRREGKAPIEGAAASSSGTADQDDPAFHRREGKEPIDDEAEKQDRRFFDHVELEWNLAHKNAKGNHPKCCHIL